MDRLWLRSVEKLNFVDPAPFLVRLRHLEIEVALSDADPKVKALRTNSLKVSREQREAALFCHGMGERIGTKVWFAHKEDQDHDFVASWITHEERHFAAVQLKEVVPIETNPKASIQDLVQSLGKYPNSKGLTVAIHLNQAGRFEPNLLKIPKLNIGSLWVFGSAELNQSRWLLWGNFTENDPYGTQFFYPET